MAVHHGVGVVNHAIATGITSYKDGLETAASAATGYPVTDLETIRQDTGWRPADSDPGNSRLLVRLDNRRPVGAVVASGLEEMTGPDDAYRIGWAKDWMEKPSLPLIAGKTDLAVDPIPHAGSWTLAVLFRAEPLGLTSALASVAELRNHATTSTDTTVLGRVSIGATGGVKLDLPRFGGSANATDIGTNTVNDTRPHIIYVSFDGTVGPHGTATVYLSSPSASGPGTISSIGTLAALNAFGAQNMCMASSGNHHVGRLEVWDVALTAAQISSIAGKARSIDDPGLVCGLNVDVADVAADPVVADVVGPDDHDFDLDSGGGTYGVIANPLGLTGPVRPRYQPWRTRPLFRIHSSSAGEVKSGATLKSFPTMTFGIPFQQALPPASSANILKYTVGAADYDAIINIETDGTAKFFSRRGGGAQASVTGNTNLCDGVLRFLSFHIGHGEEMSLAVNGVAEGGTDTAPAYAASAGSTLELGDGGNAADFETCGPIFVVARYLSPSAAYAAMTGTVPLMPSDPDVYVLHSLAEGTGNPANALGAGAGTAGDLTITTAAGTWIANGATNPVPGSQVGTMADRPWQAAWEIAEGVNHDADEILLEVFAPSAATLTVYCLYPWEVIWPEIGITGGQESGAGPALDITSVGVQRSEPGDTGRDVSYAFAALSHAEASNIQHHCVEARRTRRSGATSPKRPIALLYRSEDSSEWAERCAILIPDLPRSQLDVSQMTWERSLTVGGRELRYGSNL